MRSISPTSLSGGRGLWESAGAISLVFFGSMLVSTLLGDDLHSDGQFVVVSNSRGVTILDDIRPVLCYQRAVTSRQGKWPRADYVHPLYDLDGQCITEDFPKDHGHQRGLYWAWHQVLVAGQPVGDAWACIDFQWDVEQVDVNLTEDNAAIHAIVIWKSPALTNENGELLPLVQEQIEIVVHHAQVDVRWIDFSIELLALMENVEIGGSADEKGYGGFSARLKLSDDMLFTGVGGEIEPVSTAIDAGPAVDISGESSGVAIFSHPGNPNHPPPWILRRSQSMQNVVYPGRQPIPLSQTQPLNLRYRLGIHRGKWTRRGSKSTNNCIKQKAKRLQRP